MGRGRTARLDCAHSGLAGAAASQVRMPNFTRAALQRPLGRHYNKDFKYAGSADDALAVVAPPLAAPVADAGR
ncbi:MAG: hypothetical protein EOO65_04520 [Methanosarcinales archaeon]|nr:MAG: hypothetical protein EOO65_04520 [Methanosarcinales archaeon]